VAPELVRVIDHPEFLPAADLVLGALDFAALEFHDSAARQADHVIVVVAAEHRLVPGLPFGHLDLVDEPRLDEAGQGPVEGGPGHLPSFSAEDLQEIVGGEMTADRQHLRQNGPALAGHLEVIPREKLGEPAGGVQERSLP